MIDYSEFNITKCFSKSINIINNEILTYVYSLFYSVLYIYKF